MQYFLTYAKCFLLSLLFVFLSYFSSVSAAYGMAVSVSAQVIANDASRIK